MDRGCDNAWSYHDLWIDILWSICLVIKRGINISATPVSLYVIHLRGVPCVAAVFERADRNMYDDKARLKEGRA